MKKLLKDDIVKVSFGQEKFVAMSFNLWANLFGD
jgi:hypothetical protein